MVSQDRNTAQRWMWITLGSFLAVLLDQLTKWWASRALADGQSVPLLGDVLSLRLIHNPGAAFSLGESSTWIFTVIALIACAVIPWIIARTRSFPSQFALGMIWAGAMGNLIDRLWREPGFGVGHVVDFINYADIFIGNVADIELVLGVVAYVLIESFRSDSDSGASDSRSSSLAKSPSGLGEGKKEHTR